MSSMEQLPRLCLTSMPALLVQRRLRWFVDGELIKDSLLPTSPRTRPTEGAGSHFQDNNSETPLRTMRFWLRTMEKGLGESLL